MLAFSASSSSLSTSQSSLGQGQIQGTLIHKDSRQQGIGIQIELYAKNLFGSEHYLGKTASDQNGHFDINYKFSENWLIRYIEPDMLVLKVVSDSVIGTANLFFHNSDVLQTVDTGLTPSAALQEIGEVELSYEQIPDALDKENSPPPTLEESLSYDVALVKAVVPSLPGTISEVVLGKHLSPSDVQAIYDKTSNFPKIAPTPENLLKELLNGICGIKCSHQDSFTVTWTANWDKYDFKEEDGKMVSLPNVTVIARKEPSGLIFESITIQDRGGEAVVITSVDSQQDIQNAVKIALSNFAIKGEADIHLADGHLLPGTASENFFKYITEDNPLYSLLKPFLEGLPAINYLGSKGLIFGKGSVLEAAALSDDSVNQLIIDAIEAVEVDLLSENYSEPVDDVHVRAKHAKGFFNVYKTFFSQFIEENVDKLNNPLYLKEIVEWAKGMNERLNLIPLIISQGEDFKDPAIQKRMAIFLANIMNKVTFLHWSAHSRQQLLMDGRQAVLGLRVSNFHKGMELDSFGGVSPKNLDDQLRTAETLLNDKDTLFFESQAVIHPGLFAAVQAYVKKFPVDYDWMNMFLRTDI